MLVPLVDAGEEVGVVITQRASAMRHHSNDWVFPGGALDASDPSPGAGAVREASEELGISAGDFEVLGQLDSRGPIITGFVIDVFVALVDASTPWRPARGEVREVATVPLRHFVARENSFRAAIDPSHDPGPIVSGRRTDPLRTRELLHFFIRSGEHLWGLQADILAELLVHLDPKSARYLGEGRLS